MDPAALLELAQRAATGLDDRTPAPLRELLAMLCIDAGDAHCAHFNGLRAAIAGSPNGRALLRWLAEQHPSEDVRADAAGWLGALDRIPGAGSGSGADSDVAIGPDGGAGMPDAATAEGVRP